MQTEFNYRDFLLTEYKKRSDKNPQYSLRAFARDLQLTPSRLSEALNRKCGISPRKATSIAEIIGMNPNEKSHFVTLVEAEHGRSKAVRRQAENILQSYDKSPPEKTLELEWIKLFSSWHYNAILELVYLDDFKPLPIWISRRLGISVIEAREALSRLLHLGLLKMRDGKVYREENHLAAPMDVPSPDVKRVVRDLLKKADDSFDLNSVEEREMNVGVFPIDSSKLKEAKAALRAFQRKFCTDMVTSSKKRNRVYCLGLQFFPLDQESAI